MINNNEIKLIQEIVEKYLNYDLKDERQNKLRLRANVEARMFYFLLCRKLTKLPLAAIGMTIKPRKDHSTVLHNSRTLENIMKHNKRLAFAFEDMYNIAQKALDGVDKYMYTYEEQTVKIQELEEKNRILVRQSSEIIKRLNKFEKTLNNHKKYLKESGYDLNKSKAFKILDTNTI